MSILGTLGKAFDVLPKPLQTLAKDAVNLGISGVVLNEITTQARDFDQDYTIKAPLGLMQLKQYNINETSPIGKWLGNLPAKRHTLNSFNGMLNQELELISMQCAVFAAMNVGIIGEVAAQRGRTMTYMTIPQVIKGAYNSKTTFMQDLAFGSVFTANIGVQKIGLMQRLDDDKLNEGSDAV